nr:unnamed protein product [Spirometra erinaceieuropaei]
MIRKTSLSKSTLIASCLASRLSLFSSPSLSSIGMPAAYPASTSPIYNRFTTTSPVPIIMPPTYTAQVHMPLPAFAHTDPRFAAYGGGGFGGFGIAGGGGAGEYLHQPSGTLRPPPIANYWHPGSPSFHSFGLTSKEPEKSPPVASTTDFCYTPMCGDSIPQPCKPPSGDSLLPKGTYNLSSIGTSNPFKGHSIPNEAPNLSFTQNPPSLSPSLAQVKPVVQAPPMNYGRPMEQAPGIAMPPTIAGRLPVTYRPIQAMSPRPMNNSCPPPPQQPPQKPQQQLQPQQQFHTQGPLNPNLQQVPIKTLPARRMANPNAQPRPHLSAMFSNEGRQQQQQPPRPPMQQQTEGAQSLQPAPMVGIAPPPALPSVPNIGTTGPQFGLYRLPANKGEYVQLEKRYDWLQQEKSRLESDLSKLPLRGKVPNRGNVTIEEDRLNQNLKRIDREVSALRLIMKKYQSNLASQRTELSKTKLL